MRPAPARLLLAIWFGALQACVGSGQGAREEPPQGPLPDGVTPTGYRLELEIVPERERFAGEALIQLELARPLRAFWLHAQDLRVREVGLGLPGGERLPASLELRGDTGLAEVRLPRLAGPGPATLHVIWDAPLGRQLRGLYRVDVGEDAYAFSQF